MVWRTLFAVAIVAVVAARIRLLGIPLERDEGEYAYSGQLMLQGISPYQLAYNMKFPGTYAAYSLVMFVFGQSIAGVHLGLLLVNAAAIALMFLLGRRLLSWEAGVAAAASYAVLSLMPYTLGLAAHATHFVVLPVLAGVLLLLRSFERPSKAMVFGSGIFFGLGLLMKQPAVFFILLGTIYLVAHDLRTRQPAKQIVLRGAVFLAGAIAPLALACLLLFWGGVFGKFWFWTVQYARAYGTRVSPGEGVRILVTRIPEVISAAWPIWSLALIGLLACIFDKEIRRRADFFAGFFFFSFLALCPGFYFRPHYFILVLPAVSLLVGASVTSMTNRLRSAQPGLRFIPALAFAIALGFPIWHEKDFFFERSVPDAYRMVYGTNPFAESVKIAEYLKERTNEQDTIAVLGSEPQIYFYSHRHSATGYIYTYGLMEPHRFARQMQQEMIREIETARPKYLVLVVTSKSWLLGPDSDQSIFRWANRYCDENYVEVGWVNISEEGSTYNFGEIPAHGFSGEYILIYQRKA